MTVLALIDDAEDELARQAYAFAQAIEPEVGAIRITGDAYAPAAWAKTVAASAPLRFLRRIRAAFPTRPGWDLKRPRMIWPKRGTLAKSEKAISTIGRNPSIPKPIAAPTVAVSLIGVSRTRSGPEASV